MIRRQLLGCPVDAVTLEEAVGVVDEAVRSGRPIRQMSLNAGKLVKLQRDEELRDAVESSDLITADGQSVVWASRLLGQRLPERVAGIDLMDALLSLAALRGYRVYLLGARQEVVEEAARRICRRHPSLPLAGYQHGYFGPDEEDEVVGRIERAQPDLLFVALETPAKEIFLARHRDRLGVNFAMGIGGTLDVIAGLRRRAPRWMQRAGLEWVFRFAQDPRRMARRYIIGNTQFAWLVLRAAARREVRA
jgi:N-acetylglucosaminyldiphosphoundecaprenol N-acetyl-beta-D-mannosaminyltransferase